MRIEWVKKVYSDGCHNAFTGMAYYAGKYYLAFRNASGHMNDESEQIIMTSGNGEDWELLHKRGFVGVAGSKVDYRDSYFLLCGDRLLLYSLCTPVIGGERKRAYSQVQTISSDSMEWPEPSITVEDSVLWKPIEVGGRFYAIGYSCQERKYFSYLFQSEDGFKWEKTATVAGGSEACLYPSKQDRLTVFLRTETPPYHLEIFESDKPFDKWVKIGESTQIIQCPHTLKSGGKLLLIGRYRPDYMETADPDKPSFPIHRTKIWEFKDDRLKEVIELPSSGDNAYAGTAFMPDGSLLLSYYSQHESGSGGGWKQEMSADIFIAKISLR